MTWNTKSRTASVRRLCGAILAAAVFAIPSAIHAQGAEKAFEPAIQTFYLHNAAASVDVNDVTTALRNMLPNAKIYSMEHTGAITVRGSANELESAQKLITDLDRVKKTWRLTYTVTEIDSGKASEPQHFTLTVAEGSKAYLKQGTRVPIVTGKYGSDQASPQTQMQYIDIGLSFEASLDGYQDGVRLKTKFEQSAIDSSSGAHPEDPVISQTTMETTSALAPGKQASLGSVAEPNSPHHVQVSVLAEPVK